MQEELFIKFAEFEEKVKEVERARAIFRCPFLHRRALLCPCAVARAAWCRAPRLVCNASFGA